jgi:hypothetical protein
MTRIGALGNPLQPPLNDGDMGRFLTEVESHPDFLEVQQRLGRLAFDCSDDQLMAWSMLRNQKGGRWKVERRQLHRQIGLSALAKGSEAEPGDLPLGVLLIGAPGSGKTSVGAPIAASFGVQFVVVNADDYKEQFPEYRGWNAAVLHEESAYLAEDFVYPRAVEGRRHLLFDMTGTNGDKMVEYVEDLTAEGYMVHCVFVSLPPWKATARVWERFQSNPLNRDPRVPFGRFVPPRYVYEEVDGRPAETYNRLKAHGAVVSWQSWSTDVPRGSGPVLLEKGAR